MKYILVFFVIAGLSCGKKTETHGSQDSIALTNQNAIEELELATVAPKTVCIDKNCDSFIVSRILNPEFQIVLTKNNWDDSFNHTHLSIAGKAFLIDSILIQPATLGDFSINGIFKVVTSNQNFVVICALPGNSSGSRGWSHLTILFQLMNNKPVHAWAYNSITLKDPEVFKCISDISCAGPDLNLRIWGNYDANIAEYKITEGNLHFVDSVRAERPK